MDSIFSLLGTSIGTLAGIIVNSKLTGWRLSQLESKVDKHNNLIERMYKIEARVTILEDEVQKKG